MVVELLVKFGTEIWRAICRVVDVKRNTPKEHHTATEYADAFLFKEEEDRNSSDSSSPPSILGGQRH